MHIAALLLSAVLGSAGLLSLASPADDDATVRLTLTAARYWPAAASIRVTDLDTGSLLTRQLTAAEAADLRGLTLAPGRYSIVISAPRLAPVFRDVVLEPRQSVDLGPLALGTLPRIRGLVRDADGAPLAGAEVRAGSSEAETDADGRSVLEPLPGQWPEFATISARARGTRVLDFPKSTADAELPTVTLGRPARLRVTLTERPAGDLSAALQITTAAEQLAVVRRARLDAPRKSLDFDGLGSGVYVLLIRGQGTLQQFATQINLGSGDDRKQEIEIHPLPFTARVTMGGEPLRHAEIALRNLSFQWHADLETDDAGRFAGELWQPGDYTAEYRGGSTAASSFLQPVTLGRTAPVSMNLDIARREVRGQLLDSDGFPVAGARVFLHTDTRDSSSTVRTETAPDGRFAFEAVVAGRQKISVLADGYLIPDEVRFVLHPDDTLHDVPIRLQSGILRTLRVADAAGHPPVAADVVAVSNGVLRASAYADQEGRVRIPVADAATVVFILGRDGSFAALRPANEDITAVTLAAPASSLRITTRTTHGQPLPGVAMLIAYGDAALPLEVASRFEHAHGSLRTDRAGELTLRNLPAGTYRFWPYATDSEAESILASDVPPPITVNVKPGENAVVVEFQAK